MDARKLREFGHACFGPVMLHFTTWLGRVAAEKKIDALYFLAREGHFLMAAHERLHALGLGARNSALPSRYLLTSRRAVFGAANKSRASLKYMLDAGGFTGSLHALLRTRLGDSVARVAPRDRAVSLPRDTDLVLDLLVGVLPRLNEAAAEERTSMLRYLRDVGLLETKNVGLVDLGYSGSIQRYLHEIAGVPMTGFYFSTTKRVDAWRSEANQSCACFGEACDVESKLPVYRHSLLLESWLTSPDPQLLRFDDAGKPIFAERGAMQIRFRELQAISAGVHEYFEDVARLGGVGEDVGWFAQDVMTTALFAEQYKDIVSMLSVEDRFCGNKEIEIAGRFEE